MMDVLTHNLIVFAVMMILYLLMFGANTIMGIHFNTNVLDKPFDWGKFWKGIRKGLIAAAGMTLMVVGFSLVPIALVQAGFGDLSTQFADVLSLTAVIGVAFQAIYGYGIQALEKFKAIMSIGALSEEEEEREEE